MYINSDHCLLGFFKVAHEFTTRLPLCNIPTTTQDLYDSRWVKVGLVNVRNEFETCCMPYLPTWYEDQFGPHLFKDMYVDPKVGVEPHICMSLQDTHDPHSRMFPVNVMLDFLGFFRHYLSKHACLTDREVRGPPLVLIYKVSPRIHDGAGSYVLVQYVEAKFRPQAPGLIAFATKLLTDYLFNAPEDTKMLSIGDLPVRDDAVEYLLDFMLGQQPDACVAVASSEQFYGLFDPDHDEVPPCEAGEVLSALERLQREGKINVTTQDIEIDGQRMQGLRCDTSSPSKDLG
ncbi:hypothetical protein BD311DRAFT_782149 [Dichomitus squalens]|uniref:Uncharacterized protein n=1 Tax=Dichomitus squalens TaxID=114155 RepID=A0A4Q9MAI9_9APHY|nr:hypothetical protein BD311DRAFT_782149 [Dichomitus squalens]